MRGQETHTNGITDAQFLFMRLLMKGTRIFFTQDLAILADVP